MGNFRAGQISFELLRSYLEKVQQDYASGGEQFSDAITPVLAYKKSIDREIVAFICALFAYGRVSQIQRSLNGIFSPLGKSPTETLKVLSKNELKKMYRGWKHRFNDDEDLVLILLFLQHVLLEHKTLENFFEPKTNENGFDLLARFYDRLTALKKPPMQIVTKKRSLRFLIPDPNSGSACKRMHLFLRWMVGDSATDLKLWKRFSKQNLIIPVDTHIYQQSRALGFTKRKTLDRKTAYEITEALKNLDPQDPTRFDFALCHLGMNGTYLQRKQFLFL